MGNKTTNNTYSDTKNRSLTERTSFRFAFFCFFSAARRVAPLFNYLNMAEPKAPLFLCSHQLSVCRVWFVSADFHWTRYAAAAPDLRASFLKLFLGSLNALFFSHDDALCHKCTNHKPHSLTPVFFFAGTRGNCVANTSYKVSITQHFTEKN